MKKTFMFLFLIFSFMFLLVGCFEDIKLPDGSGDGEGQGFWNQTSDIRYDGSQEDKETGNDNPLKNGEIHLFYNTFLYLFLYSSQ